MKNTSLLLSSLFVFVCGSMLLVPQARAQNVGLQSIQKLDFGLFPPKQDEKQNLICGSQYSQEAQMGIKAHQGHCPTTSYKPEAVWVESESKDEDIIIRILKRNPNLISFGQFLEICKPLGGYLSGDGMYCGYTILF